MGFVKTNIAKEGLYGAKKPIKICDVNVDNIVVSKLIETKTNSKYLPGYLDEVYFGYLDIDKTISFDIA